jgi:predicted transcriptional regulator
MRKRSTPLPCELIVKAAIPAIRAMVAKELAHTYMMKQEEVAVALGLTQSAVSQYLCSRRGKALKLDGVEAVKRIVKDMAAVIYEGKYTPAYLNTKYCEACRQIREARLLCALHKKVDPSFNTEGCDSCISLATGC